MGRGLLRCLALLGCTWQLQAAAAQASDAAVALLEQQLELRPSRFEVRRVEGWRSPCPTRRRRPAQRQRRPPRAGGSHSPRACDPPPSPHPPCSATTSRGTSECACWRTRTTTGGTCCTCAPRGVRSASSPAAPGSPPDRALGRGRALVWWAARSCGCPPTPLLQSPRASCPACGCASASGGRRWATSFLPSHRASWQSSYTRRRPPAHPACTPSSCSAARCSCRRRARALLMSAGRPLGSQRGQAAGTGDGRRAWRRRALVPPATHAHALPLPPPWPPLAADGELLPHAR
jgi:hypothetical protein